MDRPTSEPMVIDDFESLQYPLRETDVDEPCENVEGMSAGPPVAKLIQQARFGLEDEVSASFPLLAESGQRVMSYEREHLLMDRFMGELKRCLRKQSSLRRKQKLNFFRLVQSIRDEHGTTHETSTPNCFKSFEDIVELERDIEINNSVEFIIQCMRLDLVDDRYVDQMFRITSTVEQLSAVYDEIVLMLERYKRHRNGRLDLSVKFQFRFGEVIGTRQCGRSLWRDIKMYVERAAFVDPSAGFTSDVDIPDADLDEALSCLLSNAQLFHRGNCIDELAQMSTSLLNRGASLYHRDQHGVSSLRRLFTLGYEDIVEWPLRILSTYICCPLKYKEGNIVADNRRLAPLSCLAARRIPSSTTEELLPEKLRPFVRSHRELREMFAGHIRSPEFLDEWRQEYTYDSSGESDGHDASLGQDTYHGHDGYDSDDRYWEYDKYYGY